MKPVKSITFGGLLAAIYAVITLMLKFEWVPGLDLLILFFLPIFSAIYAYKTKLIDYGIFFISTALITLLNLLSSSLLRTTPVGLFG